MTHPLDLGRNGPPLFRAGKALLTGRAAYGPCVRWRRQACGSLPSPLRRPPGRRRPHPSRREPRVAWWLGVGTSGAYDPGISISQPPFLFWRRSAARIAPRRRPVLPVENGEGAHDPRDQPLGRCLRSEGRFLIQAGVMGHIHGVPPFRGAERPAARRIWATDGQGSNKRLDSIYQPSLSIER